MWVVEPASQLMPLVLAVVDVGSSCGRRMLVGPVYLASFAECISPDDLLDGRHDVTGVRVSWYAGHSWVGV